MLYQHERSDFSYMFTKEISPRNLNHDVLTMFQKMHPFLIEENPQGSEEFLKKIQNTRMNNHFLFMEIVNKGDLKFQYYIDVLFDYHLECCEIDGEWLSHEETRRQERAFSLRLDNLMSKLNREGLDK